MIEFSALASAIVVVFLALMASASIWLCFMTARIYRQTRRILVELTNLGSRTRALTSQEEEALRLPWTTEELHTSEEAPKPPNGSAPLSELAVYVACAAHHLAKRSTGRTASVEHRAQQVA